MKSLGIITHNFPINLKDRQNAGIFVCDIAQELAKNNKVAVFCPADGKREKKIGRVSIASFPILANKKFSDFKPWNPVDVLRFFIIFISGSKHLFSYLNNYKIDINVVMWAFPSGVFAYLAKKIYKVPYFVWCLGSDIYVYGKYPIIGFVVKEILKSADYIFADGIDLARQTTKLSGKRCIFLPSASKAEFRKNVPIKKNRNKITLTFIGRMEMVKGPDIFLNALGLIKNDIRKFKVNFVGGGSLLEKLKKKAKEENINKEIYFYGNISDFQKISEIMQGSDWLIIPSRSDSIPLVFSEAMKTQTPVIASDLPDLKYLVEKYRVGLLFNKENGEILAKTLRKLVFFKKEQRMFSLNCKKAAKDFSLKVSTSRLIGYIEEVI